MNNEITLKLRCSINKLCKLLENKGFKIVDKFFLDDTYYIHNSIDINKMTSREALKEYVLIRNITQYMPKEYKIIKMTYKMKEIKDNGDIVSQKNIDCEINNIREGQKFLNALGYKKIMNVKENDVVYGKGGLNIAIKDVENGDNLIEIETIENNPEIDTVDKLKEKINELQIPIDTDDYFVKKAEIELKKIL